MSFKISVVIPVFNEEGNVAELHREIKAICEENHYSYEIIIVDDGSTDHTVDVLRNLSPLKGIFFRKNFGQTAATDAGIKAASGNYIVTMDGDCQNDPRDIPRLIEAMETGKWDVISGWRKNRNDNLDKRFVSRCANFLRRLMINDGIHDSGCSLKIYKRECFAGINLYGEMHRFIPAILKIKGFKISEIIVNHRPRTAGHTKYNWKRSIKGFVDMVSVWFWNKYAVRPLHLLGGLGLLSLFFGSLSSLYTVYLFFAGQSLSHTAWPILSAFFLITGVQLFIAGLLADFLSKTYYETTKDRPYHIKQVIENK